MVSCGHILESYTNCRGLRHATDFFLENHRFWSEIVYWFQGLSCISPLKTLVSKPWNLKPVSYVKQTLNIILIVVKN